MNAERPSPSFAQLVRTFARIGCLGFGGPAGQIAMMQREVVDERGWVDQGAFLRAINLCHLLPGPEAQQLATWIGWRLHGVKGGLAAGGLFVLPGALVMLGLSALYAMAAGVGWFAALFLGIKAAVVAILAQALLRIGKRALRTRAAVLMAVAAFLALAVFSVPFPVAIVAAGIGGALAGSQAMGGHAVPAPGGNQPSARRLAMQTAGTVAAWLAIWFAPLALIAATLGTDHVLWDVGAFFARLAAVTFGGAYAVLAYMAQAAVEQFGWLSAREMADGLGLAETTPGPLIMVTQFTGTLAVLRAPDPFAPWLAALLGAGLTTWVTFAPCFLWIFAFAPWMERLERAERLQSALAGVTAAVVGIIAQLALWFAGHVLFARFGSAGMPEWSSLDWRAVAIAAGAALMVFRWNRSIMEVIAAAALAGLVLSAV